jgi:hypothetical protein
MLYVFTIDLMICKLHRFAFYAFGFDAGNGLELPRARPRVEHEHVATAIEVQEVNQPFFEALINSILCLHMMNRIK